MVSVIYAQVGGLLRINLLNFGKTQYTQLADAAKMQLDLHFFRKN